MPPILPTGSAEVLNASALFARVGVRAGMHVADLGCGVTGHIVIPAARAIGAEGKIYAVDVQKSALAATEGRAKLEGIASITFVWSDLERVGATNIPAASLDITFVVNTLFLTKDRATVLREAARLTKPGGLVVVVEWKPVSSPLGPPLPLRLPPQEVRTAAQAAGLTERESFDCGPYHFAIVFVTPSS